MIERRKTARRRVCLGGRVLGAAFLPATDCMVRDVSLGGARIRIPDTVLVPDRFDLLVPCRSETRRVAVAWRAGDVIGLVFEGPAAPPEAADSRLATGAAEVARLRAALLSGNSPEPGRVH